MTFTTPPPDFNSKFDIVGCYVEYDGKFIALKRGSHKPQGNQYGLPAGKVDKGESLEEAILREVKEETGITIDPSKLQKLRSFPTRYPDYDFIFHTFKTVLVHEPIVTINPTEHSEFIWITPVELLTLPLAMDGFADYTRSIYTL